MSGPAPRVGTSVAFALVLLSPLVEIPGAGPWGERLALLAAAAGVLAFDRARGPAFRSDALAIAAGALLAVHGLSLLRAHSPGEGLPALVLLLAGVLVFLRVRTGGLRVDRVPLLVSALGFAFAAVGLVQAIAGAEAVSTLGNRNYSGTLAAMLLPVPAAFAARPGNLRDRLLSAGAALALFAYLVVSDSRAGLLAGAVGTAVATALALRGRPRLAMGAAAVVLALFAAAPLVARGAGPFSTERRQTVSVRLRIWEGALTMLADRSMLGVGAGNFAVAFPPYRSLQEARLSHGHEKRGFKEVEDAHSSWVQTGAETGVPGLLAWGALAAFAGRAWVRRLRTPGDPAFAAGLGGGALAFLIGGFFNTLTLQPAHAALFWAFLGLIDGTTAVPAPPGRAAALLRWAGVALAVPAVAIALRTALAERAFLSAMSRSDPAARLAALESSLGCDSRFWRAHEAKASLFLETGRPGEAAPAAAEVLAIRPHGALAMNYRAVAMLRTGEVAEGERLLERALRRAPHCWVTHANIGALEYERGAYARAGEHFAAAEFLAWSMPRLPYRRAEAWLALGNLDEAVPALRRAKALGYPVSEALRRDHPRRATDPRLSEFFP